MIYTVTLNPSVDYIVEVEELTLGGLNRMKRDMKLPGGKGINVSRVLKQLGVENTATGFLGGFTGGYIDTWLGQEGISATSFLLRTIPGSISSLRQARRRRLTVLVLSLRRPRRLRCCTSWKP